MEGVRDYTNFGCCAFWEKCNFGKGTCVYVESNPAKRAACGLIRNQSRLLTESSSEDSVLANEPVQNVIVEEKPNEPKFYSNRHGQYTLF